jgi:rubredoxin
MIGGHRWRAGRGFGVYETCAIASRSVKRPDPIKNMRGKARRAGIFQPERKRENRTMKKWQCIVCGLIYNEADGWPDDGIAPGTRWEDVPEDWLCPDCGVGKMDFEMIEIA